MGPSSMEWSDGPCSLFTRYVVIDATVWLIVNSILSDGLFATNMKRSFEDTRMAKDQFCLSLACIARRL
jgi:hypothetical protein